MAIASHLVVAMVQTFHVVVAIASHVVVAMVQASRVVAAMVLGILSLQKTMCSPQSIVVQASRVVAAMVIVNPKSILHPAS